MELKDPPLQHSGSGGPFLWNHYTFEPGRISLRRVVEPQELFANSMAGIPFVAAVEDRATSARHLADIAWETEVWIADAPSYLVHFNGDRFLDPH